MNVTDINENLVTFASLVVKHPLISHVQFLDPGAADVFVEDEPVYVECGSTGFRRVDFTFNWELGKDAGKAAEEFINRIFSCRTCDGETIVEPVEVLTPCPACQ